MSSEVTSEKLYADLRAVVRDAEALLKSANGVAGEKVDEVRARAEQTFREARARLQAAESDAMQTARDLAGEADSYVRANPWQSVGIAAGIGLILGLLMGRRS